MSFWRFIRGRLNAMSRRKLKEALRRQERKLTFLNSKRTFQDKEVVISFAF